MRLKETSMAGRVVAALMALCIAGSALAAAPAKAPKPKKNKPQYATALTPEKAGSDYKVQGEYAGTVAGDEKIGVQVIALGDGAFQAVFYPGGLPGAGWDGKVRIPVDGKTQGDKTVFAPSKSRKRYGGRSPAEFSALARNPAGGQKNYTATISGDALSGKSDDGKAISARKVMRKSPTLGAKPPAGAIVLFDGTNADQWVRGRMDDRKLLMNNTMTKKMFQSFTLHAEFITPFKPKARGQARGNSGVYIHRRYEIQVLDSFGLEGRTNECGGVYGRADPKPNMCFPPLSWQTYDIDFQAPKFEGPRKTANAVITLRHNGVAIHKDLNIPNKTGRGQREGPAPGPIFLQGHGNPVFYRNVWIVEKK